MQYTYNIFGVAGQFCNFTSRDTSGLIILPNLPEFFKVISGDPLEVFGKGSLNHNRFLRYTHNPHGITHIAF